MSTTLEITIKISEYYSGTTGEFRVKMLLMDLPEDGGIDPGDEDIPVSIIAAKIERYVDAEEDHWAWAHLDPWEKALIATEMIYFGCKPDTWYWCSKGLSERRQ